MEIHVVGPGENIASIAMQYGVPMSLLMADNRLTSPNQLVQGQTLVIRFPLQTHTVRSGETVFQIAAAYGIFIRQLYRNNPILNGSPELYTGQTLVIEYDEPPKEGTLSVNGYAYPFIDRTLLQGTLPFLTNLTPFTYGIHPDGSLVDLDDTALIASASALGTAPLMHLSTLTEDGGFSNELAHLVLTDATVQAVLMEQLQQTILQKGYAGLDVDFEFVYAEDADAYASFIARLREMLSPLGLPVIVALAPKTSSTQPGLLYEGHNYAALGNAADQVLLMTYEWGYTYGPPMAVAPLPNVRRVVEYALTEISPAKIWLGVPNYGYDWTLPFIQGESKALSISNEYAVSLAWQYGVSISYDAYAQAPFFNYQDENGRLHEVWFEDARSIRAKLSLIPQYGLWGGGYWNLMRPFPQNWLVLDSLYSIREE